MPASNFLYTYCQDDKCQHQIFFKDSDPEVYCFHCGQTFQRNSITDVQEVQHPEEFISALTYFILISNVPKRGPHMVKVHGLSHFHAKLLSPFITIHGMKLNTTMPPNLKGQDIFWSVLSNHSFCIESKHINIEGYGKDQSGGCDYLREILGQIRNANSGRENLIPLHADGDGHCLVHAISRTLIGRELLWHPLRCHLKSHFLDNLDRYKNQLQGFIFDDDWKTVINECDPEYIPQDGTSPGMQRCHIFGLASVLKRPIILLAAKKEMENYAGIFLPIMVPLHEWQNQKEIPSPICIAWNNSACNHFIPLVAVKGEPFPRLPAAILPEVFGVSHQHLFTYIPTLDPTQGGYCEIGYGPSISEDDLLSLVEEMNCSFRETHGFHPILAADLAFSYQISEQMITDWKMKEFLMAISSTVSSGYLFCCTSCHMLHQLTINPSSLKQGGDFYQQARSMEDSSSDQVFLISASGKYFTCIFDKEKDILVIKFFLSICDKCNNLAYFRKVLPSGSIEYSNGDRTRSSSKICKCGFKHYWEGKEYDNLPQRIPVLLKDIALQDIFYFQFESDPTLNSNIYNIATHLVNNYFPSVKEKNYLVHFVENYIHKKEKTFLPHDMIRKFHFLSLLRMSNEYSTLLDHTNATSRDSKLGLKRPLRNIGTEKEEAVVQPMFAPRALSNPKPKNPRSTEARTTPPSPPPPEAFLYEDEKKQENAKKKTSVEVVVSDGRMSHLPLKDTESISFDNLQTWIEMKFNIPRAMQRITKGCPPKDLLVPSPSKNSGLKPGDRIQVINLSQNEDPTLDHALFNFVIEAAKARRNVWDFAKDHPEHFQLGGIFYRQAQRDLGPLTANKHLNLPLFQSMVFRYNQVKDRLELCLEPHGHFPISSNVDYVNTMRQQIRQGPGYSVLLPKKPDHN